MKKLLCLAVACLTVLLCSCSGSGGAKPLSEVFKKISSEVKLSEMVEFDDVAALDRYYGITKEQVGEFAGGINNSGVQQEEIVLIKAADEKSADSIKTALENRKDAKYNENKNYNPEQAEIIKACDVEKDGLYVSLIISPEAEKITKIYESEIGE